MTYFTTDISSGFLEGVPELVYVTETPSHVVTGNLKYKVFISKTHDAYIINNIMMETNDTCQVITILGFLK